MPADVLFVPYAKQESDGARDEENEYYVPLGPKHHSNDEKQATDSD
jgi:hypothetical protein